MGEDQASGVWSQEFFFRQVKFEKMIRHSSRNDTYDLGVKERSQTWKYNLRFINI